jgi:histidinol phosphatase-like PHP family hydrolase
MKLIDLHTHTFFSDGVLSPSELVYRYKNRGCEAIALTDHIDYSNMDFIINSISQAAPKLSQFYGLDVIVGAELTYVPPADIDNMVKQVRAAGAKIVVVHGETAAEEVPPGTNMAAVNAKCDILAHPGHLTDDVAGIAKENGVCIELTTRAGHNQTNKEVFAVAHRNNCDIVLNTDTHMPENMLDESKIDYVMNQCGIDSSYYEIFRENSLKLVEKIKRKSI